jgi:ABC-2 type transport system ATP-binding protein
VTLKEAALDGMLTGRQFLELVGALWGMSRRAAHTRAEEVLGLFELPEVAELRLSVYPTAIRRRLDLAASLVRAPEVLLLDEPTTGLGSGSRYALWDEIRRLRAEGSTVFLTTRHAEEARAVADRMVDTRQTQIESEEAA